MKRILSPVLPGQAQLHVQKHIDGGFVFTMGREGVKLSPREAYDVALCLLKNLGVEVAETHKRPDDLGGHALGARIKLVG